MKNHLKISVVSALFLAIFVPQIALAAWWNPFSWTTFSKKIASITQEHSVTAVATTTTKKATSRSLTFEKKVAETKTISTPDNSAVIKEQARVKADETLKAQAEQDALVAKQKADEQARIDAVKAESGRQIAQQAQAQQLAAQQAEQDRLTAARNVILSAQQVAQDRYQSQYQVVQAKIRPIQDQYKTLEATFLSQECSGYAGGETGIKCLLASSQGADVAGYENAIQGDFLTPVTDASIIYENRLDDLQQQIFQIKIDYHQQIANIDGSGTFLQRANGMKANALTVANSKIDTLNQQIQTIMWEYQSSLHQ